MTVEDYRRALRRREELRVRHRALAGKVDGFITLAHIGPGQKGQPRGGTPWYNDASSAIGAPSFNLPLLVVDGVPLGVQIVGFEGRDQDLSAIARWLLAAFGSPAIGAG
jgi:Asp-tRNA(Asn)/Glu-tRNA(Gln) amidotransferase A subunit family amidase